MLALTLWTSWLWGQTLQATCQEIERPSLTLEEMVDVKLKVDESERQGSAPLRLTGREATFVLREVLRLPVRIQVEDGHLQLQAALPYRDDCYNITYDGTAELHDGMVTLSPSHFVVGDLDLSTWAQGATPLSQLAWISAEASDMASHLESLHIDGDHVVVDIVDVRVFR